jgi:putative hydrolase of the HAD superfamily
VAIKIRSFHRLMRRVRRLARDAVPSSTRTIPARELAIGFDADDTLWHNENIFEAHHTRYCALLSRFHDAATVERVLLETELRNLDLYGYGVKSFTLSAIETAIHLTTGKISAAEIQQLLDLGREMLAHPVELLDGAADTLAALAAAGVHRLLLITKGDLRDQHGKLARSGLAAHFHHVEVLPEKNGPAYATLLQRQGIAPENFLMVGNSLKSDILPVLELGGAGAHIPYRLLWAHERTDETPCAPGRFFELQTLRDLPSLVTRWAGAPGDKWAVDR